VPLTPKDLVIVEITDEMLAFSKYVAKKRQLFEFERKSYGNYDTRGIDKIKIGILGELAFLEFIFNHLEKKYSNIKSAERNSILHNKIKFSYTTTIGKFDKGFDFALKEKTIDIKTYQTNKVTISQIFNGLRNNRQPLSLFIDKNQSANADIYIQAFILTDNRICLAGFYEGVPPLQTWMPTPAYACPVTDLKPLSKLLILSD